MSAIFIVCVATLPCLAELKFAGKFVDTCTHILQHRIPISKRAKTVNSIVLFWLALEMTYCIVYTIVLFWLALETTYCIVYNIALFWLALETT